MVLLKVALRGSNQINVTPSAFRSDYRCVSAFACDRIHHDVREKQFGRAVSGGIGKNKCVPVVGVGYALFATDSLNEYFGNRIIVLGKFPQKIVRDGLEAYVITPPVLPKYAVVRDNHGLDCNYCNGYAPYHSCTYVGN